MRWDMLGFVEPCLYGTLEISPWRAGHEVLSFLMCSSSFVVESCLRSSGEFFLPLRVLFPLLVKPRWCQENDSFSYNLWLNWVIFVSLNLAVHGQPAKRIKNMFLKWAVHVFRAHVRLFPPVQFFPLLHSQSSPRPPLTSQGPNCRVRPRAFTLR